MAALRTQRAQEGQRDKRDTANSVPETRDIPGTWERGTKGHTPYRGVPLVPLSLATPERVLPFESEHEAAAFEERAAIREYDGGLSRAAAERLAWLDLLSLRVTGPSEKERP